MNWDAYISLVFPWLSQAEFSCSHLILPQGGYLFLFHLLTKI